MVDQDGGITGRYNFAWSPRNTTKASMQVGHYLVHCLLYLIVADV